VRIFQQPFSWKALSVDVRGRSRTLRINYRTSHQIRSQADRLLGPQVTDGAVDGLDSLEEAGPPEEIGDEEDDGDAGDDGRSVYHALLSFRRVRRIRRMRAFPGW
jgi:hypothetical protein